MTRSNPPRTWQASVIGAVGVAIIVVGMARCSARSGPLVSSMPTVTMRIGIGGLPQLTSQSGLQQFISNLSIEGLIAPDEDGRPRPWLAEGWATSRDGLLLTVRLRQQAKFHDGTDVNAPVVVQVLRNALPGLMGQAFEEDVEQILALDNTHVQIRLRQPSRLLIEALETTIRKPGQPAVGTGPYLVSNSSSSELEANTEYYLGRPALSRIALQTYPSVRTAWAELLRGNLDMLYEVNMDALDSLRASSDVSVFSFLRHYQYVIMFGERTSAFKAAAIRRELNAAIDRNALVRDALNGHGIPSIGPVPPQHWALEKSVPKVEFNPALAKSLKSRNLRFTCLVPADSVFERMALVIKQQLAAAGVDMQVEEVSQDQIIQAGRKKDFEALLIDVVSGPSMFRSFRHYYSKAPFELKPPGNPSIDAALNRVRYAPTDDEYRKGVTDFQRAILEDPPEVFLVWAERARAASHRFDIPTPEDGRDIINTARLWRPATVQQRASRN